MKVRIDHTKLIDSPYNGEGTGLFNFTKSDTDDFLQDLRYGKPTCYLISGYRGAGKSSYIKKLEEEIKEKDKTKVFVYLNFAKYENRSIILRKLLEISIYLLRYILFTKQLKKINLMNLNNLKIFTNVHFIMSPKILMKKKREDFLPV